MLRPPGGPEIEVGVGDKGEKDSQIEENDEKVSRPPGGPEIETGAEVEIGAEIETGAATQEEDISGLTHNLDALGLGESLPESKTGDTGKKDENDPKLAEPVNADASGEGKGADIVQIEDQDLCDLVDTRTPPIQREVQPPSLETLASAQDGLLPLFYAACMCVIPFYFWFACLRVTCVSTLFLILRTEYTEKWRRRRRIRKTRGKRSGASSR